MWIAIVVTKLVRYQPTKFSTWTFVTNRRHLVISQQLTEHPFCVQAVSGLVRGSTGDCPRDGAQGLRELPLLDCHVQTPVVLTTGTHEEGREGEGVGT